ncbi:hydroxyacylglutathione hydrolase [Rheinheimera sp. YQF-2]|jgi:hydroxyacylglutathione hydrolase|uniref:Hydroxyacylglutathione hydrolase n=1 Tax=Rheinheimera lutimaris TaxID=2740584 RepID=A0A7Y5ATZ8_9GAMM|nr:hydroxyacylglutathione hydrolase [Rheinheimera lutimaris]NRQ43926.1 hydroxyacylglutathione hydrolase [Rheinheimera lutimaris]
MSQITPIPAFEDNYIWALCQPGHSHCMVVDPGDAEPVLQFLAQQQKQLHSILVTHHHADHTGGIAKLRQLFPDVRVIGPAAGQQRIPQLTEQVKQGDAVSLTEFNLTFDVIALPGHTLDHIAFYSAPVLFCGDTLFSAGCGRLFEGSAAQMWHSLQKLLALPDNTQIFCTHEYTVANLQFALHVDSDNAALSEYSQHCRDLRLKNQPTLPVTLANEKKINPFLRSNNKLLQKKWQKDSALALFTMLRAAKDQFKA